MAASLPAAYGEHICGRCGAREMSHAEYRIHLAMVHNVVIRAACGVLALALAAR